MSDKSVKVVVIKTDGRVEDAVISDDKSMQKIVGGWFEPMAVLDRTVTMYMDEEATFKNKPQNLIASEVAKHPILGDVFVAGPTHKGHDTDIPDEARRMILAIASKFKN